MSIQVVDAVRRSPRRMARLVWNGIPEPIVHTAFMRQAGRFIYRRFTRDTVRVQTHYTLFMRNPPLLRVLAKLMESREPGVKLKVASIGCSTGAELYSLLYVLRKSCPDLDIIGTGADLSDAVVDVAREGRYQPDQCAAANSLFFAGRPEILSDDLLSLQDILETTNGAGLRVRDWIRDQTRWLTGDATDPKLIALIGQQDIVLANNVMGPMEDRVAETCLQNVMNLVAPSGYLVVDGIDLDVKSRIMKRSGFKPVSASVEEIWNADASKEGWPWLRWGREPFDRKDPEGKWRYTILFNRTC